MSSRPVSVRSMAMALALAAALLFASSVGAGADDASPIRTWTISYRAWNGRVRHAYVVLPAWYGPREHPRIPLVISPHGRGARAIDNVRFWGNLPALDRFAVVNPAGQGRRLALYSWGAPGEIRDLARMPRVVQHALPWLRIDHRRIYAVGGSMGGQETLLLVARYPHELAGAISFDADTNLALRYRDFQRVRAQRRLQRLARYEIGGTPATAALAFARRSPIDHARAIATSGVPLQIWWSTKDRVVIDQAHNSRALFERIARIHPAAPVIGVVGTWKHTAEMWYFRQLPAALEGLGLLPQRSGASTSASGASTAGLTGGARYTIARSTP